MSINFDRAQADYYQIDDDTFENFENRLEDEFSFSNDNSELYMDEKGILNIKQNNTQQTIQDSTKTSSNTDKIIVVTKQRKSSKIKFETKTNPVLEEEINKIIINKMNINPEDKLKFLLDINPKDIRILKIKDELINNESKSEYLEEKITFKVENGQILGIKRNDDSIESNRRKSKSDNIIKKIKNRIIDFLLSFVNKLINSLYSKDKINQILSKLNLPLIKSQNEDVLKKIDDKIVANHTNKSYNLEFLSFKLKGLLSKKNSERYSIPDNYNELIISELLKDDENKDIFNFVFNEIDIEAWLQIFTYQKELECYMKNSLANEEHELKLKENMIRIDEYLMKYLNSEKDDKIYYHCFLLLLYNFRIYLSNKKGMNF
jgi:hypothetical protein